MYFIYYKQMRYIILFLSVFIALYYRQYLILAISALVGLGFMAFHYLKFTEFIQKLETEEFWYQVINPNTAKKVD